MSARGPTALKGSKGPRWMYAQGFAELCKFTGLMSERVRLVAKLCGIDIKSEATFTKRRSYIGNGDG